MKREVIFLLFIVLVNFVCADYKIGDYSIDKYYKPSGNIKGWVNLSFQKEPANSLFSDSFGNKVTLINLLESNKNLQYSCNIKNCSSDYSPLNGETEKSFDIGIDSEKIFGFLLEGDIIAINSIDFVVESDAGKSCYNQIRIDFGLDGTIETGNSKSSLEACDSMRDYGCFDENITSNEYIIGRLPNKHCQRINLSASAGFNLGAWINPEGDSRSIKIALYKPDGEPVEGGVCEITNLTTAKEYSCEIEHPLLEKEEYYVCVYSEEEGTSKIKGYSDANGCGFYGEGIQDEDASFRIFAEGRKFDSVGILNITNSISYGNTLSGEMNDYLTSRYEGLNCSGGCIIPFKILSGEQQRIILKSLKLKYETSLGNIVEDKFYELEESPAKVTADSQKIRLDYAGFKTPSEYGNYTFDLKLNGENVLSENIFVEDIPQPKYLIPTKTASAFPTSFRILLDSDVEIRSYKWDFGDNSTETTQTNKVSHTYSDTGTFILRVTIEDTLGRISSREFDVVVVSPKELLKEKIEQMQQDLSNLEEQINSKDVFYQQAIKSVINLDKVTEEFKQIQRDYASASTEEEYNQIVERILDLKIPSRIITSKKTENLLFYPLEENINLEVLGNLSNGNYPIEEKDDYLKAVLMWEQKNVEVRLSSEKLSGVYDGGMQEDIVNLFKLSLKAKEGMDADPYIIIKKMENLMFKENYLETESSGYFVIDMNSPEKIIEFSTTEDVDFFELPVFISPGIERLELLRPPSRVLENMKWGWLVAIIMIILLLGFGTYIFLQEWYKRKYENYLFRERNDLYNLIVYIKNAKERGESDEKIKAKLKEQGWRSEQIDYVIKKYLGKRTGMVEIPVMKFVDKVKNLVPKKDVNKVSQKNPSIKRVTPARKI